MKKKYLIKIIKEVMSERGAPRSVTASPGRVHTRAAELSQLASQELSRRKEEEKLEKELKPQNMGATSQSPLKQISQANIRGALNQLAQKGINAEKIGEMIDDAVKRIAGGAGGQKSRFMEKDLPIINTIKNQLMAVLNGDLSTLKESNNKKNHYMVSPYIYDILTALTR